MRVYEKREGQRSVKNTQNEGSSAILTMHGTPNSAIMPLRGRSNQDSGYAMPDLEQRMQARLSSVWERPQTQIPQAEREAERLSSYVSGGTPDAVKSMMGRRMGADFSGIRFHTGATAAAKADALGARAYTSGADVYFGTAGFDPSVAAHELVHTAQQGAVESGVATMATPVGGVQMLELSENVFFKGAKKAWQSTAGRAIRKHHDAMNELHTARTGNSANTANAANATGGPPTTVGANAAGGPAPAGVQNAGNAQNAVADSDWSVLTKKDKLKWIASNPLAYMHYKSGQSAVDKTKDRIEAREEDVRKAREFLGLAPPGNTAAQGGGGQQQSGQPPLQSPQPPQQQSVQPPQPQLPPQQTPARFLLTTDGNGGFEVGNGTAKAAAQPESGDVLEDAANLSEKASNAATVTGNVGAMQEAGMIAETGKSGVGFSSGITNLVTGAVKTAASIKKLISNWKKTTSTQRAKGVGNTAVDALKTFGGAAEIAASAGKAVMEKAASAVDIVSGGVDMVKGAKRFRHAFRQYRAMREFTKEHRLPADPNSNGATTVTPAQPVGISDDARKELLYQTATQGKKAALLNGTQAVSEISTGAMDATAGALGISGVGLVSAAGLKIASAGTKMTFAIANQVQKHKLKKLVTAQTGITDKLIKDFMKDKVINNYSRAKQALMKALGYESGYRAELFADQTEKRGKYLAEQANAATTQDDEALKLVQGLGVTKKKDPNTGASTSANGGPAGNANIDGSYQADEIVKQLGGRESRGEILRNVGVLKKTANERRQNLAVQGNPANGPQPAVPSTGGRAAAQGQSNRLSQGLKRMTQGIRQRLSGHP